MTHDQDDQSDYGKLVDYYLFSSDDMVNWQDHGIIWNSKANTSWANLAYAHHMSWNSKLVQGAYNEKQITYFINGSSDFSC